MNSILYLAVFFFTDLSSHKILGSSVQFYRKFPLGQDDIEKEPKPVDFGPLLPKHCEIHNPSRDYTPPSKLQPDPLIL